MAYGNGGNDNEGIHCHMVYNNEIDPLLVLILGKVNRCF